MILTVLTEWEHNAAYNILSFTGQEATERIQGLTLSCRTEGEARLPRDVLIVMITLLLLLSSHDRRGMVVLSHLACPTPCLSWKGRKGKAGFYSFPGQAWSQIRGEKIYKTCSSMFIIVKSKE